MGHGSKKWIRDWRGRLKRSTDRTQKDWQGALGARRSRDAILNRAYRRRWGSHKKDGCPQCKFLNKNRPIHRWTVIRELGVLRCYSLYDNPTYLALKKRWGYRLEAQEIPPGEFGLDYSKEAVKIFDPLTGKYTRWGYFSKTRYRIYVRENVHDIRDTRARDISQVIPDNYPDITCDPCCRKENVAWRLHHSGTELNRRYARHGGRSFAVDRRLEERARRAEVRNLLARAKHNSELYDHIPTHIHRDWLD